MENICIRCKGRGLCGQPCRILAKFKESVPRIKTHFSGSTPPEVFVGRINYPNVFSGILSPVQHSDTTIYSSPEQWVSQNLSIEQILELRGQMIYGRSQSHIKSSEFNKDSGKFKQVTQELALSSKPVSTEFFLKHKPEFKFTASRFFQIIANPAPIQKILLEENPKVEKKVDYLTNDYDVKSIQAIKELYKAKILTSHLQKLLSVGLLGVKSSRKMVPTRWSITAIDDTLGKTLLENIRYYQELNEIQVFSQDYNGNHFDVLFLPGAFSFEVIETSMPGSVWSEQQPVDKSYSMQDYEGFFGRKTYATNVVGAYYTDRLAVCEYLNKIKRQATVLLLHEERPEYYAPLGVGIIRESLRKAFTKKPQIYETIEDALRNIKNRTLVPTDKIKEMSWVLKNYGEQKSLKQWF